MESKPADVDAYLAGVPDEARATLQGLRQTIKAIAPGAIESISYGVPAFKYQGRPLAYFAAAKNHCSLYGINVDAFQAELAAYDASKGTIRFPPGKPLPRALVKTLISTRIAEIEASAAGNRAKESGAWTTACLGSAIQSSSRHAAGLSPARGASPAW